MASAEDAGDGFDVGDVVTIEPGGGELTVVGLADDAQLNVGPTLFVTYDDLPRRRRGPATPTPATPLPNALGVAPGRRHQRRRSWSASINAPSDDLDALTRDRGRRRGARAWPRCASRSR